MLPSVKAHGEILEDLLLLPTNMSASRHFKLNPAYYKFNGLEAATTGARSTKTTTLEQKGNALSYEAKTSEDHLGASVMADLGAGAAIGLSHQTMFRKSSIAQPSLNRSGKVELLKETQSALKLVIELIEGLNTGMSIRYVYQDHRIVGNMNLSQDLATEYRAGFVGYGAGMAYDSGSYGVGYAYYPPLRGKTTIMGEEYIIVERGEIVVDAYAAASRKFKLALLFKRWINELDDRAGGSTADDDRTNIALLGLDPDQYLSLRQFIMAAVDLDFSQNMALRLGAGREEAELNFSDFSPSLLSTANVQNRPIDPVIKYNRARVVLKFSNAGLELSAGGGLFQRAYDYPEDQGGARYKANGRELFASIGLKL